MEPRPVPPAPHPSAHQGRQNRVTPVVGRAVGHTPGRGAQGQETQGLRGVSHLMPAGLQARPGNQHQGPPSRPCWSGCSESQGSPHKPPVHTAPGAKRRGSSVGQWPRLQETPRSCRVTTRVTPLPCLTPRHATPANPGVSPQTPPTPCSITARGGQQNTKPACPGHLQGPPNVRAVGTLHLGTASHSPARPPAGWPSLSAAGHTGEATASRSSPPGTVGKAARDIVLPAAAWPAVSPAETAERMSHPINMR